MIGDPWHNMLPKDEVIASLRRKVEAREGTITIGRLENKELQRQVDYLQEDNTSIRACQSELVVNRAKMKAGGRLAEWVDKVDECQCQHINAELVARIKELEDTVELLREEDNRRDERQ